MEEEIKSHIKEILRKLFLGKEIIDENKIIYTLEGVVIQTESSIRDKEISIDDLVDYEVYINPKDLEIEKLNKIIEKQNLTIQEMFREKNEPKIRVHKRLSAEEKKEACVYAIENPHISKRKISEKFGVSISSMLTILDEGKARSIIKRS